MRHHPEINETIPWQSVLEHLNYCRNLFAAHQNRPDLGQFSVDFLSYQAHLNTTRSDRYNTLMGFHKEILDDKRRVIGRPHHYPTIGDIELLGRDQEGNDHVVYSLLDSDNRAIRQWQFSHSPLHPGESINTAWEAILTESIFPQEGTGRINLPLKYLVEARWFGRPVEPMEVPDQVLIYPKPLEGRDYTSVSVRGTWEAFIVSRNFQAEKEGLKNAFRIGTRPSTAEFLRGGL